MVNSLVFYPALVLANAYTGYACMIEKTVHSGYFYKKYLQGEQIFDN
jgi:hypothetical protein